MVEHVNDLEIRRNLILSLCQAINACNNLDDAARLIEDLLSEDEALKLAKRLKIAQLLVKRYTYAEIREILKVSENTIARVNVWLKHSGQGYKRAVSKIKPLEKPIQVAYPFSFEELKRRYPLHHAINHLVDSVVDNNYKKKKQIAINTPSSLKKKSKLTENNRIK